MGISSITLGSYYVTASIPKIFVVQNEDLNTNTITLVDQVAESVSLIENNHSIISIYPDPELLATIIQL